MGNYQRQQAVDLSKMTDSDSLGSMGLRGIEQTGPGARDDDAFWWYVDNDGNPVPGHEGRKAASDRAAANWDPDRPHSPAEKEALHRLLESLRAERAQK
jgi:hypothetical protein